MEDNIVQRFRDSAHLKDVFVNDNLGKIVAVVTARSELPPEQLMIAELSTRLAKFKVPQLVFFREDPLPRNASGKVVKNVLAAQYGNDVI